MVQTGRAVPCNRRPAAKASSCLPEDRPRDSSKRFSGIPDRSLPDVVRLRRIQPDEFAGAVKQRDSSESGAYPTSVPVCASAWTPGTSTTRPAARWRISGCITFKDEDFPRMSVKNCKFASPCGGTFIRSILRAEPLYVFASDVDPGTGPRALRTGSNLIANPKQKSWHLQVAA